ncbi:phage Gp37/Gp68 family protein [Ruminococcaceae bacterium OttesenSCG-928-N02]|nr:phage Gp37/Gp68 family protein [Ruminococcaceae bacterium OttesenSCG-928-N02]
MNWEPWTGCYPASDGCANCYFYGPNAKRYGQNTVEKTDKFDWPIRKNKKGEYNIKGGKILATCFATDFFLPEADGWRADAWAMIKERQDIDFLILTKRIDRFPVALPADWGAGYDNVNIGCTVENQALADLRLPLFLSYPIKRRFVAASPLLEPIDLSAYLGGIEHVTVSGESGQGARVCNYDWVLDIREQCKAAGITFWFKSTGSFFQRGGALEKINPFKQGSVAKELDISISDGKRLF